MFTHYNHVDENSHLFRNFSFGHGHLVSKVLIVVENGCAVLKETSFNKVEGTPKFRHLFNIQTAY
jgi:hypothetical protein